MQTITFDKCPLCQQKHDYWLQISRSPVFYLDTMLSLSENKRTESLLFLCPEKKQQFKAQITIEEIRGFKIDLIQQPKIITDEQFPDNPTD